MKICNVWKLSIIKKFLIIPLFVYASNSLAQHLNIQVGDTFLEIPSYPNEPSIAIDPKNPDLMIVTTNGPVNNYYYSDDGGFTWTRAGDYSFDLGRWGDPCVIADTSGNFHFFHLARLYSQGSLGMPDRVWHRKIRSDQMAGGWSDSSYVGLSSPKMKDKEWAAYDPLNQNFYVVWTEFDVYGSPDPNDSTNVFFSKSTDDGSTWSQPVRINEVAGDCLDEDNSVMGAMPAVGPNGEIFVSWPGPEGIIFDKSTDEGDTWLTHDILVANNPASDHYFIPGILRGGCVPVIACDLSNGPYRGNIYINWSDQVNGQTDTDIWLSKSTDGGMNWSSPIRVNDDPPGKHQMFHWLSVDQTNGYLYIVFYDRRNYNDNQTDVYLAVSRDGGNTFTNYKISDSPFIPSQGVFMGDYSSVAAIGDIIRPVWARMDTGHVTIQAAIIDPNIVEVEDFRDNQVTTEFEISSIYPNPFNPSTTIEYRIPQNGEVVISAYDIIGKKIDVLFSGYEEAGEHHFIWNAKKHASGVYFIRLHFNSLMKTKKVMLMK